MGLYCPVTGLEVETRPEWIAQKTSDRFHANFWIIGGVIIYSRPQGFADLEGVTKSLALNDRVAECLSGNAASFVQIEDYALLSGSNTAARRFFAERANKDDQRTSLIFCNLSPPFSIAVKLGRRVLNTSKEIHVVKTYAKAVELAMQLSAKELTGANVAPIETGGLCAASSRSLEPLEILCDENWEIQASGYAHRSMIVDRCILHSTAKGYAQPEDIQQIVQIRHLCRAALNKDEQIEYIVVDSGQLEGGNRLARAQYMQSVLTLHRQFPLKLYITYGANNFAQTVLHILNPLVPFRIVIAKDAPHAFELIREDQQRDTSHHIQRTQSDPPAAISQGDIEQLMAFIGSIDWELEGINSPIALDEKHPLYFLYQSLKLIKEELDELFIERRRAEKQIRASLAEKETLLREVHHRTKNNMQMIRSMLNIQTQRIDDQKIAQILNETMSRIDAMSMVHEKLYQSDSLALIDLKEYFGSLINLLIKSHDNSTQVAIQPEMESVYVSVDTAVPCGLILNELVSNAFKHGFPAGLTGTIRVTLAQIKNGGFELCVIDNGVGLPAEINLSGGKTFGLNLALVLTENQLGGTFQFDASEGTAVRLRFNNAVETTGA